MSEPIQTSHFHFQKSGAGKTFCVVNVSDGLSLEHAINFSQTLRKYSGGQLYRVSHAVGVGIDGDMTSGGAYASIGLYGMVFLRDDELYTLKRIRIPAPGELCFTDQEFNETAGQDIAQAYSNFTGRQFNFDHGGLAGRTNGV